MTTYGRDRELTIYDVTQRGEGVHLGVMPGHKG